MAQVLRHTTFSIQPSLCVRGYVCECAYIHEYVCVDGQVCIGVAVSIWMITHVLEYVYVNAYINVDGCVRLYVYVYAHEYLFLFIIMYICEYTSWVGIQVSYTYICECAYVCLHAHYRVSPQLHNSRNQAFPLKWWLIGWQSSEWNVCAEWKCVSQKAF